MCEVKSKRKHPALIVLNGLLDGNPLIVEMEVVERKEGRDFKMRVKEEYRYQDGVFGVARTMENTMTKEKRDVILDAGMTLGGFVRWCEELSEETIIQFVFQVGLSGLRKDRSGSR